MIFLFSSSKVVGAILVVAGFSAATSCLHPHRKCDQSDPGFTVFGQTIHYFDDEGFHVRWWQTETEYCVYWGISPGTLPGK